MRKQKNGPFSDSTLQQFVVYSKTDKIVSNLVKQVVGNRISLWISQSNFSANGSEVLENGLQRVLRLLLISL